MDIESFTSKMRARRESAEFEFGGEWTDAIDNEYELSWVEATGELYLMVEPDANVTEDAFGDFFVAGEVVTDLTVVVIGKSPSLAALEDKLMGWEDAMLEPNSLAWLHDRFPSIGGPGEQGDDESATSHSLVNEGTRFLSGTRSDSLIVVMSAFQLPSIDVASAAFGVAFNSSLIARPSSLARWRDERLAASLCDWSWMARFTNTHDARASATAPFVPHELRTTLARTSAVSGARIRTTRATSRQLATESR